MTAQLTSESSSAFVQVVNKAATTVSVNTSGPSTYGDSVTITATVPAGVTGTIPFTSGTPPLGSRTIASGTLSAPTTALRSPSRLFPPTHTAHPRYHPPDAPRPRP